MVRPDVVLFNGGFFTTPLARARLVEALAGWFGDGPRVPLSKAEYWIGRDARGVCGGR